MSGRDSHPSKTLVDKLREYARIDAFRDAKTFSAAANEIEAALAQSDAYLRRLNEVAAERDAALGRELRGRATDEPSACHLHPEAEYGCRKCIELDVAGWQPGVCDTPDACAAMGCADVMRTKQPTLTLEQAYELGWRAAADWAQRSDLCCDIDSPAYLEDRSSALGKSSTLPPSESTCADPEAPCAAQMALDSMLARLTECELALHNYAPHSEYFLRWELGGGALTKECAP